MLFVVASISHAATAATAAPVDRVDAALNGMQHYFFDDTGSFWKACGQNGGNGNAPSHFECKCETTSPYCKNCYRWWMALTIQSLIGLHDAAPSHPFFNTTQAIIKAFRSHSPYTNRAAPAWAYIDDYIWYVLMWLDVQRTPALADTGDLDVAASTMELMVQWGSDQKCGGIHWMYPDVDPRKNAITTLEAVQASAQLATAYKHHRPVKHHEHMARAMSYWRFFEDVHLLGTDPVLVHDNVTGTPHGKFHCCNGTSPPLCEPRDTITWSYNQGMFLGAMADLYTLTSDESYLRLGAQVLDAVVTHLTRSDDAVAGGGAAGGGAAGGDAAATVLREPDGVSLTLDSRKCDSSHDPSAPAGGDLFSFKGVFMQHFPRFVVAAKGVLTSAQLAAARKLVSDSADAAWAHRVLPPFSKDDVCNEHDVPSGGPPKFMWDWAAAPAGGALTCMDARTQSQALTLFVAELKLEQVFGPRDRE